MNFELTRKSGKIQWTDEQKEYILDQYINNNASMSRLGKEFSCDKDAIKKILRDNGIHIKSRKNYTVEIVTSLMKQIPMKKLIGWDSFMPMDVLLRLLRHIPIWLRWVLKIKSILKNLNLQLRLITK